MYAVCTVWLEYYIWCNDDDDVDDDNDDNEEVDDLNMSHKTNLRAEEPHCSLPLIWHTILELHSFYISQSRGQKMHL